MEGTPSSAPKPKTDIYVMQCSKPLKGPFHYLGSKEGWHYYLFLDDMFKIGDDIKKYNGPAPPGVISYMQVNPEIKVRMPRKAGSSLLDCLLAIHHQERVERGWA